MNTLAIARSIGHRRVAHDQPDPRTRPRPIAEQEIVYADRARFTYRALDERVRRLACGLAESASSRAPPSP